MDQQQPRIPGDADEPRTPAFETEGGVPGLEAGVAFATGDGGGDVVTEDGRIIGPTDVVGPMAGNLTPEELEAAQGFPPGNANPAMGID